MKKKKKKIFLLRDTNLGSTVAQILNFLFLMAGTLITYH